MLVTSRSTETRLIATAAVPDAEQAPRTPQFNSTETRLIATAAVPDAEQAPRTPQFKSTDTRLIISAISRWARDVPLTVGAIALMLAVGAVTRTLWLPADPDTGIMAALSFGTPHLADAHLWTFFTGAVILPRPEFYAVVGALLAVGLGRFEHRVGTKRAAVALVGTHLFGTVGAAMFLWTFSDSSWSWASHLAGQVDLGLSAGAVGVAGAGTALLTLPWRRWIRTAALLYLTMMVLRSGLLWDVEHLMAFGAGLAMGPRLTGRRSARLRMPQLDAMLIRSWVALLVAVMAITDVVECVYPGVGGVFGSGNPSHSPLHGLLPELGELVVCLLIADALWRGRAAAWWLSVVGVGVLLANTAVNTRGAIRVADLAFDAALLIVLVVFRDAWRWRTPEGFAWIFLRRICVAVGIFGGGTLGLLVAIRHHLSPEPDNFALVRAVVARFTFTPGELRPTNATAGMAISFTNLVWAGVLIGLLIPWLFADRGPDASPRELVGSLLRRHGGGSLGWMRTWPAFTTWTTRDGRLAISYCVVGRVAIAIGDPVGPDAEFADAVVGFRRFCQYAGWTPCWFAATPALVDAAGGWRSTQIGEDTVIDLTSLEFVGKSWQDVRTARNRATREGITMRMGRLADFGDTVRTEIESISKEWVSSKPLPEMGFTLGTVDHAMDPEMRTHLALDADGVIQGVTTWLPMYSDGVVVGWTLDLMRRRPEGFRPVIEYLIAESAMAFKAEGCAAVSLSVAPLARRTAPAGKPTLLDRTLDMMSSVLEPTYGFRSLLAFKAKFHPEFRPVYLVYPGPAALGSIALAIGRAYLPEVHTLQAAHLLLEMRKNTHA